MRRQIIGVFAAIVTLTSVADLARAQLQGGADWDTTSPQFRVGPPTPSVPGGARNATLDELNKILSARQISAADRSIYLSIRAFLLNRLGRDAESQKDVVELGRVLPNGWQVVMSAVMPGLAGGGDRAAALRTLEYSLTRKPNDPWLLVAQAQVYMQLSDFAQAAGILDVALAGATGQAERQVVLYNRGLANFNRGAFLQAVEDFNGAVAGMTTVKSRLDGVMWRYAAQVRARQDARATLNKDVGNENLYEWPGPIAKFLLGKMPAGELEVAAESDEAAKRSNGKCPAAFFIGMDAARRGDKQRAREQFQLAQARCPTVSSYNWAASSELKRL